MKEYVENDIQDAEWISVLFGGDLHKRPKDITTIENVWNCTDFDKFFLCKFL